MNGFLLMIPFFLIRFGLLGAMGKNALKRAALFAPLEGKEKTAYIFYQFCNIFIIFYPFVLKIYTQQPMFIIAITFFILGSVVLIITTADFSKPEQSGINVRGIYKLSRNPMYVGYFVYFAACVFFTRSILLFLALLVFIISTHWIILSEERWCLDQFGGDYTVYMKKVRRYI